MPSKEIASLHSGLPVLSKMGLFQAIRWIAFALPPLRASHEGIEGYPDMPQTFDGVPEETKHWPADLKLAARQLLKALALGEITAVGFPWVTSEAYFETPDFRSNRKLSELGFKGLGSDAISVPERFWSLDRIDWMNDRVWVDLNEPPFYPFDDRFTPPRDIVAYSSVRLSFDELKERFPASHEIGASAQDQQKPFRSEFVELILRAEEYFGDRLLRCKKWEIEEWLDQQGPKIDKDWSKNKSKMMATFLRKPELQLGGSKKRKG